MSSHRVNRLNKTEVFDDGRGAGFGFLPTSMVFCVGARRCLAQNHGLAFAAKHGMGQSGRVNEPANEWERTYQAAIACPACGSTDVHAKNCPVLLRRLQLARRFQALGLLVLVGVSVWQRSVGFLAPGFGVLIVVVIGVRVIRNLHGPRRQKT